MGCFQFWNIECNEQCFPEHSNTGLLCICAQYLEVELLNGTECAFNIFIAVAKLSSKKAVHPPQSIWEEPHYLLSLPLMAIIHSPPPPLPPFLLNWYMKKKFLVVLISLITTEIENLYIYLLFFNLFCPFASHLCVCFAHFLIRLRAYGFYNINLLSIKVIHSKWRTLENTDDKENRYHT